MQGQPPADPIDQLTRAIAANDPAEVKATITRQPALVHTHTPLRRPWGEELWLPLHRAALYGRTDIAALLLSSGAKPDARTRFTGGPEHGRATALHIASAAGRADVVRLLLSEGAEVEVRDAQNLSPLQLSPKGSKVADVLRAAGARQEPPMTDATRSTYADLLESLDWIR